VEEAFPMPDISLRQWPADRVSIPSSGTVHVWTIRLDETADIALALDALAPMDMRRACQFSLDAGRRRFIAARAALRCILGQCLGVPARDVAIRTAAGGKPGLDPARHGSWLRFNVCHSADLALVALTAGLEVGVDIERLRPFPDFQQIVDRYFSDFERTALAAVPPSFRVRSFFTCWTLKEAYLKACGDGLGRPLSAFDVGLGNEHQSLLLDVRDRPGDERRWILSTLWPCDGYAAALAVQCDSRPMRT
jgi:4'-phosphopantetheinyl transferase